ncbi:ABC transporter permease [Patulibacter defluvii]|uniref:ABC transporter permease n=1 Tax=Patulibacter defluvii TaxID=3095358 RepID=UPI002A7486F8|nr:ABC transporter permease [Patulibacter sp. DM4]
MSAPASSALSGPSRSAAFRELLAEARHHGGLIAGCVILLLMLAAAFVAPLPFDPLSPTIADTLKEPGGGHWFGTDRVGFDVFSRTIYSARRDIPLALASTMVSVVLGVPLGLFAASGKWGERFMRVVDVVQALPTIVIAIVIVQLMGGGAIVIIGAIAVVNVPRFTRLVRGEAISLREMRFVEAAVALGSSRSRILVNHILRNAYGIVLVQASLVAANSIIVIAALNFLGLGFSPPEPTWGSMIQDGAQNMAQGQWWMATFPGIAVFVAVMSFNLIADGLEHLFYPAARRS